MKRLFISALTGLFVASPVFAFTPDDPLLSEQWYVPQIHADEAWDSTQGSADVVVAVLDTGIDLDHPDLAGRLWTNPGEVDSDHIDNDRNGYIDDVHGWDFVDEDPIAAPNPGDPYSEDGVAHGTAIAGVIAAMGNNGEGIAGIAWNVRIMPVRILDNFGSGTSSNATRALRYAVANGADIVNLSFTGTEVDPAFEDAVREAYAANVVVVAAVGNSGNGGIDTDETPIYPACFMGPNGEDWVIGVAASTPDDTKANFSNYGSTCADLSAPGEDIFSTMYQNSRWNSFDDYYLGGWAGTSIAAPMVSGSVALLKSLYPSITVSQVKTILQLSADPMQERGTPAAGKVGSGRVNIAKALAIAPEILAASQPEAPSDDDAGVVRDASGHRVAPASGAVAVSPVTGQDEAVSTVYTGWFVRSPSFDTIYYLDEDLHRHPFWDAQTYFTWADTWDDTVWVTDATLSTLQLDAPLVPKAGVVLVKIQSDPSVYAVENGSDPWSPILRKIVSEQVAADMYFGAWADFVLDVEPTLFGRYQRGADIETPESVDTSILRSRNEIGSLIEGSGG
jgi:subtilisin family serine protease